MILYTSAISPIYKKQGQRKEECVWYSKLWRSSDDIIFQKRTEIFRARRFTENEQSKNGRKKKTETREVRQRMSDIIYMKSQKRWQDGVKNMSKYDKMIEENQRKSKEKIELALQAIQDMLANKERISVPKLMKKTGLSRGF